jgi:hypothetical protein
MKTKFKVGCAYKIQFLDHSVGMKEAMVIDVIGWCVKDSAKFAVFSAWKVDHEDAAIVEHNHEPFSIIKSCIQKKRLLRGV